MLQSNYPPIKKVKVTSVHFSPLQSLSHVRLFATPWTAARQASLSITTSQSLLKLMSTELVTPSNHLILCRPLLLLPSTFPSSLLTLYSGSTPSAEPLHPPLFIHSHSVDAGSFLPSASWLKGNRGSLEGLQVCLLLLFRHIQLCDPKDCSPPGFPVLHQLPEFAQTRVH